MEFVEQDAALLLARNASPGEFRDFLRKQESSFEVASDRWLSCLKSIAAIHASELAWLSSEHSWTVKNAALRQFKRLFTTSLSAGFYAVNAEAHAAMRPTVDWVSTQDDYQVVTFCWDLLAFRGGFKSTSQDPVYPLKHAGRLQGDISLANIELSVALNVEAEQMFWWPEERWEFVRWDRDSDAYMAAMTHSSYLVRAAASKAVGQLYIGCVQHSSHPAPAAAEIMFRLGESERTTPGVAGPFLQGSQWSMGEWESFEGDFDFRRWFVDTLRDSARERRVPHCQALEFYAHEFLCCDAEAIVAIFKMGRRSLTVLTATENPKCIETLRPVLDVLASSHDTEVSRAIQTYLAKRTHQAGCEFVTETFFGD